MNPELLPSSALSKRPNQESAPMKQITSGVDSAVAAAASPEVKLPPLQTIATSPVSGSIEFQRPQASAQTRAPARSMQVIGTRIWNAAAAATAAIVGCTTATVTSGDTLVPLHDLSDDRPESAGQRCGIAHTRTHVAAASIPEPELMGKLNAADAHVECLAMGSSNAMHNDSRKLSLDQPFKVVQDTASATSAVGGRGNIGPIQQIVLQPPHQQQKQLAQMPKKSCTITGCSANACQYGRCASHQDVALPKPGCNPAQSASLQSERLSPVGGRKRSRRKSNVTSSSSNGSGDNSKASSISREIGCTINQDAQPTRRPTRSSRGNAGLCSMPNCVYQVEVGRVFCVAHQFGVCNQNGGLYPCQRAANSNDKRCDMHALCSVQRCRADVALDHLGHVSMFCQAHSVKAGADAPKLAKGKRGGGLSATIHLESVATVVARSSETIQMLNVSAHCSSMFFQKDGNATVLR